LNDFSATSIAIEAVVVELFEVQCNYKEAVGQKIAILAKSDFYTLYRRAPS
jgi:hypothetical protein